MFTDTFSTWYALCDSETSIHWLQPATSEYQHTSQHTNKNVGTDMHGYDHFTLHSKARENTSRPLRGLSLLPYPRSKHAKKSVGILTHDALCCLCSHVPDKCFSLIGFCFGGWAIPLFGPVFSLLCASLLCHFFSLGLKKNKTKPWRDIITPLQFSTIVLLISRRHPTIGEDRLVTITR